MSVLYCVVCVLGLLRVLCVKWLHLLLPLQHVLSR